MWKASRYKTTSDFILTGLQLGGAVQTDVCSDLAFLPQIRQAESSHSFKSNVIALELSLFSLDNIHTSISQFGNAADK